MINFRFKLARVLAWRQTQLEVEEAKFKQQTAALAELDRARAELEAAGIRAESEVRRWDPLNGGDLAALSGFRLHVRAREDQLAARRAERQKVVDAQQSAMLEARRRCRLLERLKERQLTEWQSARDRELEALALESFLAGWPRDAP